jgi:hypothetical protein
MERAASTAAIDGERHEHPGGPAGVEALRRVADRRRHRARSALRHRRGGAFRHSFYHSLERGNRYFKDRR